MSHPLDEAREGLRATGGEGEVRLVLDGPVARLTLHRPEAANALSGAMLLDLERRVGELEAALDGGWPGAGLILSGAGERAFCAGSDLALVRDNLDRPALASALVRFMHALTERLRGLPLVSVAAIEGAAVGGGAELALACDHRVLSRRAHLRFVHARLGLSPGWGGGARLVQLLGRRRALTLLTAAPRVEAARALEWGLVDALSDPGAARARALALLAPALALPAASVRAAKRLVHAADTLPLDEALAVEAATFEALWGGPDHRAAMARRG